MCIVQHVQTKSVFTRQSTKILVPTTLKNAKTAFTYLIVLLRTKNRQKFCLVHCFAKKTSGGWEKEIHLHFWRLFSANHNQTHQRLYHKKQKSFHSLHNRFDSPLVETVHKISFPFPFIHFQSTVKQLGFLGLQRRYWGVSRRWTRFSHSDCKRSHPKIVQKFPRTSSSSLERVVVSKTKLFESSSSTSSNYPQRGTDYGDERRSAVKCSCTRHGHQRVSGVWSGRILILL